MHHVLLVCACVCARRVLQRGLGLVLERCDGTLTLSARLGPDLVQWPSV